MDIYRQLAKYLDDLPGGYPSTDSGVELRILKRLFTPEEAELAMHLTLIPEESRVIARRAGITREEADRRLEELVKKGLIFSIQIEDGTQQYQASQFIIGIYEFQVNDLDPELVRDINEYLPIVFNLDAWEKTPQMRVIPINESIEVTREVRPYEHAEELIRNHDKIGLAPCICRQKQKLVGKGCDKPEEMCMLFGDIAKYYVRRGRARFINQEEAFEKLKQAYELGLVLQPSHSKEAAFMCFCCECCCEILKLIKRHPKPASIVSNPFMASIDKDKCTGCGTCVERCKTEAIKLDNGYAELNLDCCIGCGLCVTTCPTESLTLIRKPESEQPKVPKNFDQAVINLGRNRGKLSTGGMIKMLVKSKVDRIMASK